MSRRERECQQQRAGNKLFMFMIVRTFSFRSSQFRHRVGPGFRALSRAVQNTTLVLLGRFLHPSCPSPFSPCLKLCCRQHVDRPPLPTNAASARCLDSHHSNVTHDVHDTLQVGSLLGTIRFAGRILLFIGLFTLFFMFLYPFFCLRPPSFASFCLAIGHRTLLHCLQLCPCRRALGYNTLTAFDLDTERFCQHRRTGLSVVRPLHSFLSSLFPPLFCLLCL